MTLLSEDELAALKALADAATPGPWFSHGRMSAAEYLEPRYGPYSYEIRTADPDPSSKHEWPQRICETIMGQSGPGDEPNFALIAAARQAIPALLHHIDALKAELAREEKSHSITIDARDLAEDALSEIWCNVFGGDPGWSNLYGFSNAVNDIDAEFQKLRSELATARTSALKEAAERISQVEFITVPENETQRGFKAGWESAQRVFAERILAIAEVK